MKIETYNHMSARAKIDTAISATLLKSIRGVSADWDSENAPKIKRRILDALRRDGWSNPVKLDPERGITVTAMKQGTALSVQFGNMSRFYADLLKLEYLFKKGRATAAIYILPTKDAAKNLGQNIVCFERLCSELQMFEMIIEIPMLVVGVEG